MDKTALKALFGILFLMAAIGIMKPNPKSLPQDFEQTEAFVEDSQEPQDQESTKPMGYLTKENDEETLSMPETIKHVRSLLPQNGQLKFNSPAEVHHAHPAILRAGLELGHLKEQWLKQPADRKLAFDFYESCTFDRDLIESIRALCYVNAIEVSVYLKKTDKVLTWTVENSVQNLASRLMTN